MKKYLIILFILALLFISGCQVPKTGRATATPAPTKSQTATPSPGPLVTISRDVSCSGDFATVNLGISVSKLNNDEIVMIAERIPYGTSIVEGSWSIKPEYVLGNKLLWLFKSSQEIPARISYKISTKDSSKFKSQVGLDKFRGKWVLKIADTNGLIIGEISCS